MTGCINFLLSLFYAYPQARVSLHQAIQEKRTTDEIIALVNQQTINQIIDGKTALHFALEESRNDLATKLLTKGADPFISEDQEGYTAAHLCIKHKQPELLKQIFQSEQARTHVDIQAKNEHQDSLLTTTCYFGCEESVRCLLEKGALVDLKCGPHEVTALHVATKMSHERIITLLHEHHQRA